MLFTRTRVAINAQIIHFSLIKSVSVRPTLSKTFCSRVTYALYAHLSQNAFFAYLIALTDFINTN